MKLKRTFRSLSIRNYRLYFFAQIISTSGLWIQLVAENWLVVQLGGSGLMLGITTAIQFTPLLFLSVYGGVLVDRWNKHTLLMFTQISSSILALLLGILALTGSVQIWMIWIIAFLLGCVNALDTPGRQVFTRELVGPKHLTNAVALNNTISTSGRVIGPVIGAILISISEVGVCFLINAASYIAVIIALLKINKSQLQVESVVTRKHGQVKEGLIHIWNHPKLRTTLLIMFITATFGLNFQVLLPLFTSQTFQQSGEWYGLLMSSLGIGSVIGSLLIASWKDPTVKRVALLSTVFGITIVAVALSPTLPVAFITVGLMGVGSSLFLTACSGCLQLNAGDGMSGRVMAMYYVAFLGTAPIGGTAVGWIAEIWGPRSAFALSAIACMAASGFAFFGPNKYKTNMKKTETRA
ncbi:MULTISPECIES: MFS transporter [Bacillus]|uniref:MFS family permease n=1 Tax=Bacillus capparidis TaxID=1840411 RepID=A0ABS4CT86_9BACI|nr:MULTISPECIES: MFS transporter [Bacillus]MBP1080766.1 MFS family permease [Bacillus capparidis]MED1094619.1 MFS transporter [Bacillus capparidis]